MKRYLSFFMGMVLLLIFLAYGAADSRQMEAATEQTTVVYGDVNQDNKITLEDARLSLRATLQITTLTEAGMAAMDVDGNGSLDLSDVQKILQKALQIIDYFPVEEGPSSTETPNATKEPVATKEPEPIATPTPTPTQEPIPSEPSREEGKTLIVYFSWSSNTEKMAKTIQEQTNGTIYEIVPLTPYPEDYTSCTEVALEERDNNARPAIQNLPASIEEYDQILIGYPIWWHTAPMIIGTFLENYDLTGIDVYPFTQSASMNREQFENSMEFVRNCAKGATVHDGLFARYSDNNAIITYLDNHNLTR